MKPDYLKPEDLWRSIITHNLIQLQVTEHEMAGGTYCLGLTSGSDRLIPIISLAIRLNEFIMKRSSASDWSSGGI